MTSTSLLPVIPRISSLVRLMASSNDGEALGAVRALGRTLEARGATFHDLADRIERNSVATTGSTSTLPAWRDLDREQRLDWLDAILDGGDVNDWERRFIGSLRTQYIAQPGRPISRKQVDKINAIIIALWLAGVRV